MKCGKKKPRKFAAAGVVPPPVSDELAGAPQPRFDPVPERKESFKEAFARNRKAGAKTFDWNGKSYTTELAKPAAKQAPATAVARKPATVPSKLFDVPDAPARMKAPDMAETAAKFKSSPKPATVKQAPATAVARKLAPKPLSSPKKPDTKAYQAKVSAAAEDYRTKRDARQAETRMMGSDYNRRVYGNVVSKRAGGTVRGNGCATKGKGKGRFC